MEEHGGWVRAPRQARSQATFERFVQATQALLEDRSFEDITVADIVAEAGRTVGSFYARFDDKQAVLYVVVERLHRRIRDVVRTFCDPVRWEGASLGDFVGESVRVNVAAYRRSGPLFRAALQASVTDERFRQQRQETMRLCAAAQKAFVLSRRHELSCPDPSRASDMMFELVAATLDQELLFGQVTDTRPGPVGLVAELTDQSLFVLGLPARVDQGETVVA